MLMRMRVEITKRADGSGVLRCVRRDGSVDWQKQTSRHAAFFALHDLTHFAVESTLGLRNSFYGLVAQGWPIEDTTGKGARGPLPREAVDTERLVGTLDSERAGATLWTAAEFSDSLGFEVTEAQLHAIRARRAELFRRWGETAPGATLVLEFPD